MGPGHGESKGQSRERVGWSVPTSKAIYCWKVAGGPEGPEGSIVPKGQKELTLPQGPFYLYAVTQMVRKA